MCGFMGVLKLNTSSASIEKDILTRSSKILGHRGPDSHDIHWEGPCGLAHHRLSIIDCSEAGKQPMCNEKESIWIAYNGETYNFLDLKKDFQLEKKHSFRSRTDTEVILHLYEDLGLDVVKHLNGMYAFAIWDNREEKLILARDPYGVKPLFYLNTGDAFWFSSEIKALLDVPGYKPAPCIEALHHYLSLNYVPGSLTAFENIYELSPGHTLVIDTQKKQPEIRRFFDINYKINTGISRNEAVETSLDYLMKSVKRQLISDVPVGVMLSGGVDSSALTALMAKIRGNSDFHTFSIGFEDSSFNEAGYAKIVADHIGTTHHEVMVTPEKVKNMLPKYLAYIDEPYADGSAIPTYLLAEHAKDFVTVLLSGEGGDEFFAGYDTHFAYKIRNMYRKVPSFIRKEIITRMVNLLPVSHKKLSFDFKAKRFVSGAELDTPDSHFAWRVVLSEDAKKSVLNNKLYTDFQPSVQYFIDKFNSCNADDELNKLLYIDFSFHLSDDLMIKNDRMTMANSIEARVPFTDNELVNYLASVPVNHKLPRNKKKYLLRTAMQEFLPKEITTKKKVGLEMPYSSWLRNELKELAEDTLSPSRLDSTGLFNANTISGFWAEHQDMKVDHGRFFWGLLNYMLWYDMYIKKGNFREYLSPPRKPRF
jgi:asparagine synthase (glutamine-hydrolysing)